jgi:hypothetical protein
MTNKEFSQTKEFKDTCSEYKVVATKRQASKFRNKKGQLYKFSNGKLEEKTQ